MNFVLFCHSLTSDWNHGNAHFLRGITSELLSRGHEIDVYEPADGWSLRRLIRAEGTAAIEGFRRHYPQLEPHRYTLETLDVDRAVGQADVVIVHEWNPPELLEMIGRHRRRTRRPYLLLFHDTHHRAVSAPQDLALYPLEDFDGTLAFGEAIADIYRQNGWGDRVWVWHEAADTRVFAPPAANDAPEPEGDLVWIGNWGDDERGRELRRYLFVPALATGTNGAVYGVRYRARARRAVARAGLEYRGWVANYDVPDVFHRYRMTVHVPRRLYSEALPGIPTIRVFEALACGIPLVSAPWSDTEQLFEAGRDFLLVHDTGQMKQAMTNLRNDRAMAREIAAAGLDTIKRRHTCAHRVDELLDICNELTAVPAAAAS